MKRQVTSGMYKFKLFCEIKLTHSFGMASLIANLAKFRTISRQVKNLVLALAIASKCIPFA